MSLIDASLDGCTSVARSVRYPERVLSEEVGKEVVILRLGELRLCCTSSTVKILSIC